MSRWWLLRGWHSLRARPGAPCAFESREVREAAAAFAPFPRVHLASGTPSLTWPNGPARSSSASSFCRIRPL
eukprot:scaffold926_cov408-Prasinococcus_capsulatus_cf.AAC.14